MLSNVQYDVSIQSRYDRINSSIIFLNSFVDCLLLFCSRMTLLQMNGSSAFISPFLVWVFAVLGTIYSFLFLDRWVQYACIIGGNIENLHLYVD